MVQIDEMILRIPGMNTEDGEKIAGMVSKKLCECISDNSESDVVGEMNIRINSDGSSSEKLADMIAEQILLKLKIVSL